MKIIDGKALAEKLRAELKEKIEKAERKPGLAVVIVGEDLPLFLFATTYT